MARPATRGVGLNTLIRLCVNSANLSCSMLLLPTRTRRNMRPTSTKVYGWAGMQTRTRSWQAHLVESTGAEQSDDYHHLTDMRKSSSAFSRQFHGTIEEMDSSIRVSYYLENYHTNHLRNLQPNQKIKNKSTPKRIQQQYNQIHHQINNHNLKFNNKIKTLLNQHLHHLLPDQQINIKMSHQHIDHEWNHLEEKPGHLLATIHQQHDNDSKNNEVLSVGHHGPVSDQPAHWSGRP